MSGTFVNYVGMLNEALQKSGKKYTVNYESMVSSDPSQFIIKCTVTHEGGNMKSQSSRSTTQSSKAAAKHDAARVFLETYHGLAPTILKRPLEPVEIWIRDTFPRLCVKLNIKEPGSAIKQFLLFVCYEITRPHIQDWTVVEKFVGRPLYETLWDMKEDLVDLGKSSVIYHRNIRHVISKIEEEKHQSLSLSNTKEMSKKCLDLGLDKFLISNQELTWQQLSDLLLMMIGVCSLACIPRDLQELLNEWKMN